AAARAEQDGSVGVPDSLTHARCGQPHRGTHGSRISPCSRGCELLRNGYLEGGPKCSRGFSNSRSGRPAPVGSASGSARPSTVTASRSSRGKPERSSEPPWGGTLDLAG